jgi:hypothetical protein|tara:strand:+ start:3565 stop:4401 length:837 start_codon:yes stop_codon:yes gene_type:complete
MAREERDKIKTKIKSKRMFITGSSRNDGTDTILTGSYQHMSKSFANSSYLDADGNNFGSSAGLVWVVNEMRGDIEDIHAEVSQSVYVSQVSEFSSISTGSFGLISSSLIPDSDDTYDLGASGKEWNDLYIDGTAYIDAINYQGTALAPTIAELNRVDGVTSAIQTQLNAKLPLDGGTITGVIVEALVRFTDRDATPTVQKGNKFEARYSRATNITMFDNPSAGQEITIIITDAAITFVHDTRTTLLAGARNVTLNSGDTITFISNGSVWYEKCRSDNS